MHVVVPESSALSNQSLSDSPIHGRHRACEARCDGSFRQFTSVPARRGVSRFLCVQAHTSSNGCLEDSGGSDGAISAFSAGTKVGPPSCKKQGILIYQGVFVFFQWTRLTSSVETSRGPWHSLHRQNGARQMPQQANFWPFFSGSCVLSYIQDTVEVF